jgi:hypothetical protein
MEPVIAEIEKSIEQLLARAVSIHDRLKTVYENTRPDITARLSDVLAHESDVKLDADPWACGARLGKYNDMFARANELMSMFDVSASSMVSQTYMITTRSEIDSFNQYLARFVESGLSQQLYDHLAQRIKASPKEAEELHMADPHSDELYAAWLRRQLILGRDVSELLERAKTRALVGNNPPKLMSSWPLQRFRLVLVRQGIEAKQLAHIFFGSSAKAKDVGSFVNIANAKKIGVIIITNTSARPIEYNIGRLISANETKGYVYSKDTGLNAKIIERYDVVRRMGVPDEKHQLTYAIEAHPSTPSNIARWAILRTLDGARYDVLSQRIDDLFVSPSIASNMMRGPSPRVHAYNQIKDEQFRHAFAKMPEMDSKIKMKNKQLIMMLVNRIIGRIVQYIDTSLVPLPTSPTEIEEAMMNPRFAEIMNEELLKSYVECGVNADVPADEFVGTFISDIDTSIMTQFARNVKVNMIELSPGASVFKEYKGDTLRTRLYNLFVEVIKKSVTASIMTKENIYEKLLIKDNALSMLAE